MRKAFMSLVGAVKGWGGWVVAAITLLSYATGFHYQVVAHMGDDNVRHFDNGEQKYDVLGHIKDEDAHVDQNFRLDLEHRLTELDVKVSAIGKKLGVEFEESKETKEKSKVNN